MWRHWRPYVPISKWYITYAFHHKVAAIEASFKSLCSQLEWGQHPLAGKRVWSVVREEPPGHATHTAHVSPSNRNHSCRSSLAEQEHNLLPGHKGALEYQKNTVEPCCAHDVMCASASDGHPSLRLCFFSPLCFDKPLQWVSGASPFPLCTTAPVDGWGEHTEVGCFQPSLCVSGWRPALPPHFPLVHHLIPVLRLSLNPLMRGRAVYNQLHQHSIPSISLLCRTHQIWATSPATDFLPVFSDIHIAFNSALFQLKLFISALPSTDKPSTMSLIAVNHHLPNPSCQQPGHCIHSAHSLLDAAQEVHGVYHSKNTASRIPPPCRNPRLHPAKIPIRIHALAHRFLQLSFLRPWQTVSPQHISAWNSTTKITLTVCLSPA